ncbi:MAG: T9SS C-terminal target domain-containing protein [Flavobacterium sp.]|nr:MAG: T9SS C-terminal target domain-containing protein [Flavobacterium sp.]
MKNFRLSIFLSIFCCSYFAMAQSPVIDQDNPTRQVINDDLEVVGSLGVGFDTAANQAYGFDTIIMRENNLRMYFDDTSNTASFPSNDWRLQANDATNGGDNYFAIQDATAGVFPFRVDAGATANSLRIESGGNVGIGIANPVVRLHIFNQDTPTIRLDQVGGFGDYKWDVAANETNFFVRDVSGGSLLPFRIRPGAPTSSLDISSSGAVGVGTSSPNAFTSLALGATDRGLQLNRLTTADRNTLGANLMTEKGVIVYDTDDDLTYAWDGAQWNPVGLDTDDQTVDTFQLNGNNLELSLEDDGVAVNTVDLSGYLDNTDMQDLDLAGNTLSLTNDATTVDLSGYLDNTDNQDISGSSLVGTDLTIGISGGASEVVDLSYLDDSGTDDQQISLAGNTLSLEDGGSVDLSGYLDNTDEQLLGYALNSNTLTLVITDGNTLMIDFTPMLQPLIDENAAQQAQIDDLIARVDLLEQCACTLRVPDNIQDPNRPVLFQNIPNPFDNTTSIGYYIPITYSNANIVISSTTGQLLNSIAVEVRGEGSIEIGKASLQSGMYFYTLFVDGKKIDTKRMIIE